jgi:hypothetical protein
VEMVGKNEKFEVKDDKKRYESRKYSDIKEVIIKKEIEVSKTYKIIGNFSEMIIIVKMMK